jgi:hypothetical protein
MRINYLFAFFKIGTKPSQFLSEILDSILMRAGSEVLVYRFIFQVITIITATNIRRPVAIFIGGVQVSHYISVTFVIV